MSMKQYVLYSKWKTNNKDFSIIYLHNKINPHRMEKFYSSCMHTNWLVYQYNLFFLSLNLPKNLIGFNFFKYRILIINTFVNDSIIQIKKMYKYIILLIDVDGVLTLL